MGVTLSLMIKISLPHYKLDCRLTRSANNFYQFLHNCSLLSPGALPNVNLRQPLKISISHSLIFPGTQSYKFLPSVQLVLCLTRLPFSASTMYWNPVSDRNLRRLITKLNLFYFFFSTGSSCFIMLCLFS